MPRIVYVDGEYLERSEAVISCEDRGYQFGDGVYEGVELYDGKPVDLAWHLQRLQRSMREIELAGQPSLVMLKHIVGETVRRNRYRFGFIYLQVTRGIATRDYVYPADGRPPVITCMVFANNQTAMQQKAETGLQVISLPDIRWKRPDIKSLQLLPGVLARQQAMRQGAQEAWLVDEQGYVTEGAASNAWIMHEDGHLVTRPTDGRILHGVTRRALLELLETCHIRLEERPFSLEEAYAASEAFLTASTNTVMPVVGIDGRIVGDGKPGALTCRLRTLYRQRPNAS